MNSYQVMFKYEENSNEAVDFERLSFIIIEYLYVT